MRDRTTPLIEWTVWIHVPYGNDGPAPSPRKLGTFEAFDHAASAVSDAGPIIRAAVDLPPDARVELRRPNGTRLTESLPTVDEFYER
jgi:hypothetical protein